MKRLLFALLLMLCWQLSSAQYRTLFQGTDMDNRVTGISLYTPSTGYLSTSKWVGYTTDSGRTVSRRYVTMGNVDYGFNQVNLTFGFTIEGVKAFSADTLLVHGDYGLEPSILYSTNGGATWKLVYHRNIPFNHVYLYNSMYDMVFPGNGSTGFAVHGDEVLRSTDRGRTWSVVSFQPNQRMFRLSFADGNTGFVAGKEKVWRTTNGGNSWTVLSLTAVNITALSAASPSHVFVSSGGNQYYSGNGGASFTLTNTEAGRLYTDDFHFINDSTGYAIAGYGVYQTRNRGRAWEPMPGSSQFSYLNYGYGRLKFYNSQQAYALGENEYAAITSNAGGVSLPRAVFEYDASNTCVTNTVLLKNQSHGGYAYRWLRNGQLLATTYDASYAVSGASDEISLIVTKGAFSDTMTVNIAANGAAGALNLNVVTVRDTVCSNSPVYFEVRNSQPDVQYQVGRSCCGYNPPVNGNGGTLLLAASSNSYEDTTATYTISASRNGACGAQYAQVQRSVRLINSFPNVTATSDTICKQGVFFITVPNSRVGYNYWSDTAFAKVPGNGGAIQLPTRGSIASSVYNHDFDNIISTNTYSVYVRHNFGCGSSFPAVSFNITGRGTKAGFNTISHEMLTGDALAFEDLSKQAHSYVWTFTEGSTVTTSTSRLPNPVFTVPGVHKIQQKTITREGCVDSADRYIEVFAGTVAPQSTLCTTTAGQQGIDSLRLRNYFMSRAFYEDEFGNRVVAGGYTDMRWMNSFYPRGYEGFFAARYNASGALQWYLENPTGEDYYTYNRNSHIIIEQAVSDRRGYTYLLGHSLNRLAIKDGANSFPIPRAGGFLMKVSPAGRIIWVRGLYNKDPFGTNISFDYTGGSLLRGRNDEIYVVTHMKANGTDLFMSGDDLVFTGPTKTGLILQYDGDGNVLRKKQFPISYNNLRRFEIYSADSYDRLPPATWDSAGRLVIYGLLNPAEMSGNTIDGHTLSFPAATLRTALLFVDTSSLQVVNVKPLFVNTPNGTAPLHAESYAIDANGNYYGAYTSKISFPRSRQRFVTDTLKNKSYVVAFDAAGSLRWRKQLEGLQPSSLLAHGQALKIYGINYNGSGFSNGNMVHSSNSSPTTVNVRKLTMVTDSGAYTGHGGKGIASLDNVLASLDAANGSLQHLVALGSAREEEAGVMRKGYGDQFWATGTTGLLIWNVINNQDTASTLRTYRLPLASSCNPTYSAMEPFVKIDNFRNQTTCTDSTVLLNWSSHGVAPLTLSYSLNGGSTYTAIAGSLPSTQTQYSFNAIAAGLRGRVLFRLQGGSLSDTLSQVIYPMPARAYATGRVELCPYDTLVTLSGASGAGYRYLWNTGDTARTIRVQNWYREPYYDNILFRPQYTLRTTTTDGCVRSETIRLDTVKHYGYGGVPVVSVNAGGDSLVTNLCGLPHRWYKNGVEIAGVTACRIRPSGPGSYQAATYHALSGCATWKSNAVNYTPVVTSVGSLPADAEQLSLQPNPARGEAFVQLRLRRTATIQLSLIDGSGRVVWRGSGQRVPAGQTVQLPVQVQGATQGQYLVEVSVNGQRSYRKLLVVQ
jgi:photosystem II stability/assembly factor-like uncharacterized protein